MIDNNLVETVVGDYHIKLKKGRKSQAVEIVDEEVIPKEYLRVKTEVDKSKALKDLKEGIYIEGLSLNERIGEPTLEVAHVSTIKILKQFE